MSKVQQKLKEKLFQKSMSARHCAKVAGIPESSIKNIVQGKVLNPRMDTVSALARALDCHVHELIDNDFDRKKIGYLNNKSPNNIATASIDSHLLLCCHNDVNRIAEHLNINLSKEKLMRYTGQLYDYHLQLKRDGNTVQSTDSFISWLLLNSR